MPNLLKAAPAVLLAIVAPASARNVGLTISNFDDDAVVANGGEMAIGGKGRWTQISGLIEGQDADRSSFVPYRSITPENLSEFQ